METKTQAQIDYETKRAAHRQRIIDEATARAKARADARERRLALALKVAGSPIKLAVEPLRADAMDSAEQWAKDEIATVTKQLEAAGMDREIIAPFPRSTLSRYDYQRGLNRYRLVHSLTRGIQCSRRPGSPDPCVIEPDYVARFIVDARDEASAQYEKFVCKLVGKIGDCATAVLSGNHVWSNSKLVVTFSDKATETWTTKQITNVSVLGKYFPQWPSRKVKQ